MKLKKFAAIAAALAMTLSLAACGTESGGTAEADAVTTAKTEAVKDETTAEEDETAAEKQEETTVPEETTTEETTTTKEVTEPAEPGYQIPDWDSIDYADELDFMTEDVDGGVAVTEYIGTNPIVKIPETIDGKKVVQIGTADDHSSSQFSNHATDVKIPNSITKVNVCAFYSCLELKSVVIPDSVTVIEDMAFDACTQLEVISIPDSVTKIGNAAFRNCLSLKSIDIPDSVTNIGYDAFIYCSSITELNLPENVILDNDGFKYEEKYIVIALEDCKSLKSIDIPNGVTLIGRNEFIKYGGLGNCTNLESVTIPDSVTELGANAFGSCKSLKSITIPDSVTNINKFAFDNCSEDLEVTYGGTTYKYNQLPNLYKKFNGE